MKIGAAKIVPKRTNHGFLLERTLKQGVERCVGQSGREFLMLFLAWPLKGRSSPVLPEISAIGLCSGRCLSCLATCLACAGKTGTACRAPTGISSLWGRKFPYAPED